MLITNQQEFETMLEDIRSSDIVAIDTEGTGLKLRNGDFPVGISVSTKNNDYYYAFAHGVSPDYEPIGKTAKARKARQESLDRIAGLLPTFNNMTKDNIKALGEALEGKLWVFHNAPYDLTAICDHLGFKIPDKIADTHSMLAVVNSDWTGRDASGDKKAFYPEYDMPDTGKKERGGRGLKFQARLWGLTDARKGIDDLNYRGVKWLDENVGEGWKVKDSTETKSKADKGEDKDATRRVIWMLPPELVSTYACMDTRLTLELYYKILQYADKWNDHHLIEMYNDVTLATWHMHRNGFVYDAETAKTTFEEGVRVDKEKSAELARLTGGAITNVNSSQQVTNYLKSVGIETDTSSKKFLDTLNLTGVLDTVVSLIKEIRSIRYSLGVYEKWGNAQRLSGLINPEYNVGGTSTGRLSSASKVVGNLQNLPRVGSSVVQPRNIVRTFDDLWLIDIDYSALEMVLVAHIAEHLIGKDRDLTLTNIILSGADMHLYTMEKSGIVPLLLKGRTELEYLVHVGYTPNEEGMFLLDGAWITPEKFFIKKEARARAKTTNFACVYGAGWNGVMKAIGCTKAEAEALVQGYHLAYPAVRPANEELGRLALQATRINHTSNATSQYLRYPFAGIDLARKYRYYPVMKVFNGVDKKTGEKYTRRTYPQKEVAKNALNTVVQGSGGLMMLKSIQRIQQRFGFAHRRGMEFDFNTGIVVPHATVHDSVTFGLRSQDLHILPEIVDIMTDFEVTPALSVDVSTSGMGGHWGKTTSIKDLDAFIKENCA